MTTETPSRTAAEEEFVANETGTQGLSQGRIVLKRFLDHKGAVISAVVLLAVIVVAFTSIGFGPVPGWWKYKYTDLSPLENSGHPTLSVFPPRWGHHPFGQDAFGRDWFAQVMRGTQISLQIMVIVGLVSGVLGVIVGGVAGYFRGWIDAVLMRLTDMVIVIPAIVAAAVIARVAQQIGGIYFLALFLGLVSWVAMARLVRGDFLTLREREFVDAARLAGASDGRIIFKHILPNAIGVVTVNTTLLMSAAILTETSLSYVGLGVQAPDVSLGLLINANQQAISVRPWLFWYPGLLIVIVCLAVNFIGDGLRDAFDPRQKRLKLGKNDRKNPTPAGDNIGVPTQSPLVSMVADDDGDEVPPPDLGRRA